MGYLGSGMTDIILTLSRTLGLKKLKILVGVDGEGGIKFSFLLLIQVLYISKLRKSRSILSWFLSLQPLPTFLKSSLS